MLFKVFIENHALKQIKQINIDMIPKIKEAISAPAHNPKPFGYIKLKGFDAYLISVGD